MQSTSNFSTIVAVTSPVLHLYLTEDLRMYIIRPTDNVSHPNAGIYQLGQYLLDNSDLDLPEHEEIFYSYQIEYDEDQEEYWTEGNKKLIAISNEHINIYMIPLRADMKLLEKNRIQVQYVLKFMVPIEYRVIEPS